MFGEPTARFATSLTHYDLSFRFPNSNSLTVTSASLELFPATLSQKKAEDWSCDRLLTAVIRRNTYHKSIRDLLEHPRFTTARLAISLTHCDLSCRFPHFK